MEDSSERPELAVIVTTHNRADIVEETLSSLADQVWADGTWEIVLVDNDSTDDTPAILERWVEKMPVPTRVVTATEHHTPSYARHAGVDASDSDSLAFVDDDDVLAPGYVAAVGTALRRHPLVGARHEHALLNEPEVAHYRGTFQTEGLGEIFGVAMVSGGGLGCDRALWRLLGGHRIDAGYGGEDADFALCAAKTGAEATFVPDAVYHVRLRDGWRSNFRQGRRFAVARVELYRAHGADFDVHPDPPARLLRNWLGLLIRISNLRHHGPRLVWAWQLGRRIGHIQGSVQYRRWLP